MLLNQDKILTLIWVQISTKLNFLSWNHVVLGFIID